MMKRLALASIHWYWKIVREENRKVCLFKVSCSRHVHEAILNGGLLSGILAFTRRMRACNGGYTVQTKNGITVIETVRGERIHEEDINPFLLQEFKSTIQSN